MYFICCNSKWMKWRCSVSSLFMTLVFWKCFLLFSHSLIHELPTTSLIHHILQSCQSSRENAHMPSLRVISRSSVSGCRLGAQLWSGRRWRASGGLQPEHLVVAFYPPLHPLTPLFLFPATWSSHINHSQLNQQKAAGKCRGRGTIIHVAQPLMQICLLMKAFWTRRICLTAILYMSAAWPGCPLALGMRSRVKFSVLLSVLFLRRGQIYLGLAYVAR